MNQYRSRDFSGMSEGYCDSRSSEPPLQTDLVELLADD